MRNAPTETAFPSIPATWYLFGESRELRDKPLSKRLLGRTWWPFAHRVVASPCSMANALTSLPIWAAAASSANAFNVHFITGNTMPAASACTFPLKPKSQSPPDSARTQSLSGTD